MAANAVCMSDVGDAFSTAAAAAAAAAAAGKVVMPTAEGVMAAILRSDASMKIFRAS